MNTQSLPNLGLKSYLDLELIKLIYSVDHSEIINVCDFPRFNKTNIFFEYADVFNG